MCCVSVLKICIFNFTVGLGLVELVHALAPDNPRKLEVHRNTVSGECSYIDINWSQYHKDLRHSDIVKEKAMPLIRQERCHSDVENRTDQQEYLVAYSYDRSLLWDNAKTLCDSQSIRRYADLVAGSHGMGRDELSEGSQTLLSQVLNVGNPSLPCSPPLEIIPLSESGPSDNRVDITFFGDGCELQYSQFLSVKILTFI